MVGGFLSDATSLRTPAVYGGEYVRVAARMTQRIKTIAVFPLTVATMEW
jgi:hypothetical protein